MRPVLTAMLAAALLLPAPALAGPGDPPVEPVLPDDGAVLPVNADGIEVRYVCPEPYHVTSPDTFPVFGDRKDYGVHFAASPELGGDGRLLQANLVAIAGPDQVQDNDIPLGQCRAYMADPDNRPQATPGTYYWQAWRTCLDCPGGYETTPVRSFRLTTAGSGAALAVKPPARAYRGYPFVVSVTTEGIDRGTAVALQVERDGRWSTVGRLTATGAAADVALQLPRSLRPGRKRIRATAQVGDETVASAARALRLRKAKRWTTSGRQDGRWTGKASGLPVEFRVSGNGRTVRAGRFQLTLLCPTPGMVNQFTTQIADAPLPRARIAPDGSFVFAGVVGEHAAFVQGRIRGDRASGRADLTLGVCTGGAAFTARRR